MTPKEIALKKEKRDPRSDAVTFDWIVMTAAIIGLVVVILASIGAGGDGLVANLFSALGAGRF